MLPDDLKYTAEHEWLLASGGDGEVTVRVGITAYAAEQLGDVVFVSLPTVGAEVQSGQSFGEVESTKSVSDVYAPVTGTVSARNDALDDTPELINSDPYGAGWLVEITAPGGSGDLMSADNVLDSTAYQALLP